MRVDKFFTLNCVAPLRRIFYPDNGVHVPILMYHSISMHLDDHLHPYYRTVTSPKRFEEQMGFLHRAGYRVATLSEAVRALQETPFRHNSDLKESILSRSINPNPPIVVITFDDGLRDFYTTAFPILDKYAFKASVFLTTGLIDRNFLTGAECLRAREIRELADKGIEFGSHTVTHPQLKGLSQNNISYELGKSKETIEELIGKPVYLFSYPYKFPEESAIFTDILNKLLVNQGYSAGVTTMIGTAKINDNPLFLKRLPINNSDDIRLFQAKLQGSYNWMHILQLIYKNFRTNLFDVDIAGIGKY